MSEQSQASYPPSGSAPVALRRLVDRYNPEVIDVPHRSAVIGIEVIGGFDWDAAIDGDEITLRPAGGSPWDAQLTADADTWQKIAEDVEAGMDAFRSGRLRVRRNLHLGIGFLAATSGVSGPGRLAQTALETSEGRISAISAGVGEPVICLHGLGGTKSSFMTTIAALSGDRRVIAVDFPGFGDSSKPLDVPYDAPYFARVVAAVMDELGLESAHLIGNSMGGRVAIETGLLFPERVRSLVLLTPALPWLRDRRWRWLLTGSLPRLGLIQPTPRAITEPLVRLVVPGGNNGWAAAGVDEFLRSFLKPRGRVAFYQSLRNIYLDEPHGEEGLWTRLEGLTPPALFVWGREDQLVPIGFRKHVERVLDSARHVELDCGHVPQIELPDETHAAARDFLDSVQIAV
ncbi:MAG: alpha/beta fold hydrolase [Thermoleophilia bacterium]|nr:alpha/beta fold hydrolase [Thermoleophilia bacterium]